MAEPLHAHAARMLRGPKSVYYSQHIPLAALSDHRVVGKVVSQVLFELTDQVLFESADIDDVDWSTLVITVEPDAHGYHLLVAQVSTKE